MARKKKRSKSKSKIKTTKASKRKRSKTKAKKSNVIPLDILVRRQHKLTKLVKQRGGKVAA